MQDNLQIAAQEQRGSVVRQWEHAGIAACQEGIREFTEAYVVLIKKGKKVCVQERRFLKNVCS